MARQTSIDDEYPSYYNEEPEAKKGKKIPVGCPAGFIEDEHGKCLQPEFLKLKDKMKELEEATETLENAWKSFEDLAKTGNKVPFEGKTKRLNLVYRLVDENVDDLKKIKRYLFW